jgi:hypothetical protein
MPLAGHLIAIRPAPENNCKEDGVVSAPFFVSGQQQFDTFPPPWRPRMHSSATLAPQQPAL